MRMVGRPRSISGKTRTKGRLPPRPVEWHVERQLGPKEARLRAPIEYCISEETRFEEPIVDYEDDRAYVELRLAPEEDEDPSGCFLNLPIPPRSSPWSETSTSSPFFDSSTNPPEQRWTRERPRPGNELGMAS